MITLRFNIDSVIISTLLILCFVGLSVIVKDSGKFKEGLKEHLVRDNR